MSEWVLFLQVFRWSERRDKEFYLCNKKNFSGILKVSKNFSEFVLNNSVKDLQKN